MYLRINAVRSTDNVQRSLYRYVQTDLLHTFKNPQPCLEIGLD